MELIEPTYNNFPIFTRYLLSMTGRCRQADK